ncbi:MAG: M48 family metallopeptidase [Burkholderiaceae bacterium]|jgi:putative metalloprotease|nr:M48 family metallopeptidase [Burkholderiaceae bacterium]
MKWKLGMAVLAASVVMAGCSATGGGNQVGAALDVFKAVTVSEAELQAASLQMRAAEDKTEKVASAKNKYGQRLARLTKKHLNEDGLKLNFKVYLSEQVNANASPDGSIRVYSGLMDKMNDQELLAVLGHEIGHVKLGHSLAAMRTAYLASAGRKAAASTGGTGAVLAASEVGALTESFVNSQFSQSQETAADDYGVAFLRRNGYKPSAMASALKKLAALGSKDSSVLDQMFSSHPEPNKRAERLSDVK